MHSNFHDKAELKSWLFKSEVQKPEDFPALNKTKDWALVQNTALVMKIKMLKLGLVR